MGNDSKRLVRNVIQRVYRDATQTQLDDQAADEVISALRDIGWAEVRVSRSMQDEFGPGWRIERWDDPVTDSTVLRVRESDVEWVVKS